MLQTIFAVGIMVVIGLFLLKLVFGILGGLFGLVLPLFFLALKIAMIGLLVYFIIRIISPDTARRLREQFGTTKA